MDSFDQNQIKLEAGIGQRPDMGERGVGRFAVRTGSGKSATNKHRRKNASLNMDPIMDTP